MRLAETKAMRSLLRRMPPRLRKEAGRRVGDKQSDEQIQELEEGSRRNPQYLSGRQAIPPNGTAMLTSQ